MSAPVSVESQIILLWFNPQRIFCPLNRRFAMRYKGRSDGMIPAPSNIPAAAPLSIEGETQIL